MKIFIPKINESWVVDRIRNEWILENPQFSTKNIYKSDVIWILAPWLWKKIPKKILINSKVICTYHHLDKDNKNINEIEEFKNLDQFVDEYHVISNKTKNIIQSLTDKKITSIPIWVNSKDWYFLSDKSQLRKKYSCSENDYLVGSFQRDTEGNDLMSPKLIKGPDLFVKIIKDMYLKNKNLKVILTGKRRQYVISELEKFKIPYKYFEMVKTSQINELYNILDLYLVTSRLEGGPQAIVECGITKTPIISTNVGIAEQILSKESIFDFGKLNYSEARPNINVAYSNSIELESTKLMKQYRKMFVELYEN